MRAGERRKLSLFDGVRGKSHFEQWAPITQPGSGKTQGSRGSISLGNEPLAQDPGIRSPYP